MAVINAYGAHEVARVICDRVTSSKGVELEVNRLFVMTSDGRILTRDLDSPADPRCPYRITERGVPDSVLNVPGLLAYVRAQRYRVRDPYETVR